MLVTNEQTQNYMSEDSAELHRNVSRMCHIETDSRLKVNRTAGQKLVENVRPVTGKNAPTNYRMA